MKYIFKILLLCLNKETRKQLNNWEENTFIFELRTIHWKLRNVKYNKNEEKKRMAYIERVLFTEEKLEKEKMPEERAEITYDRTFNSTYK